MTIGVVCALYNGKKYIIPFLESLLAQTIPPDKVLLMDDVSKDDTYEIVQNWIVTHNLQTTWKLGRNDKNCGHAENFVNMIRQMDTDLIFCSDQDDILMNDKLEVMSKCMEEHQEINVLCSKWLNFANETGIPAVTKEYRGEIKVRLSEFSPRNFWPTDTIGCCMALRGKVCRNYLNYWNANIEHDCFLWACANLTNSSYFLDYITLLRRVHSDNASMHMKFSISKREKQVLSRLTESTNLHHMLTDSGYSEGCNQIKYVDHYKESLVLRMNLLRHFSPIKIIRIAYKYRDCYLYFPKGLILDSYLSVTKHFIKK